MITPLHSYFHTCTKIEIKRSTVDEKDVDFSFYQKDNSGREVPVFHMTVFCGWDMSSLPILLLSDKLDVKSFEELSRISHVEEHSEPEPELHPHSHIEDDDDDIPPF